MNTTELPDEQRLHDQLQVGFDEADGGNEGVAGSWGGVTHENASRIRASEHLGLTARRVIE